MKHKISGTILIAVSILAVYGMVMAASPSPTSTPTPTPTASATGSASPSPTVTSTVTPTPTPTSSPTPSSSSTVGPISNPVITSGRADSDSQITIDWNPSTGGTGVAGYHIYRNGTWITSTNNTMYSDSGLNANTTYKYYVVAYDTSWNTSGNSNIMSVVTLSPSPSPTATASASATPTPTATPTASPSASPTSSSTASPTAAPSSVDTVPPSDVALTGPADGSVYESPQDVTITGTASDNVGLAKMEFYDGTRLLGSDNSAPFSYKWTIGAALNGPHFLTVRAYDTSGLSAASLSVKVKVSIPTGGPVYGWAWSSNIGWISFNCTQTGSSPAPSATGGGCGGSDFKVSVDNKGDMSGYAWSPNIGWLRFGGLSGEPNSVGNANVNIKASDSKYGMVTGATRFCAGTLSAPGSCSTMNDRTDGWNGWMVLSDATNGYMSPDPSGNSGVTLLTTGVNKGHFVGYSWGGPVVGWVNWNPNFSWGVYCPKCVTDEIVNDPVSVSCLAPVVGSLTSNGGTISIPVNSAHVTGGSGAPFQFKWWVIDGSGKIAPIQTAWKNALATTNNNDSDSITVMKNTGTSAIYYTVGVQAEDKDGTINSGILTCGTYKVPPPAGSGTPPPSPSPTNTPPGGGGRKCQDGAFDCPGKNEEDDGNVHIYIGRNSGAPDSSSVTVKRGDLFAIRTVLPQGAKCQYAAIYKGNTGVQINGTSDDVTNWSSNFSISKVNDRVDLSPNQYLAKDLVTGYNDNVKYREYMFALQSCSDAIGETIDNPNLNPPSSLFYVMLRIQESSIIEI